MTQNLNNATLYALVFSEFCCACESSESEDCHEQGDNTRERQGGQKEEVGQDLVMKGEAIEVVDGGQTVI